MKKRLEEMQTLRARCSKAEPKIFAPPQTPSRGAGRPKFNQLVMVTSFTYKPSLVRLDARNFELSWQQTHKHSHNPHTQTGPITIHCAAASAQCNKAICTAQIRQRRQGRKYASSRQFLKRNAFSFSLKMSS